MLQIKTPILEIFSKNSVSEKEAANINLNDLAVYEIPLTYDTTKDISFATQEPIKWTSEAVYAVLTGDGETAKTMLRKKHGKIPSATGGTMLVAAEKGSLSLCDDILDLPYIVIISWPNLARLSAFSYTGGEHTTINLGINPDEEILTERKALHLLISHCTVPYEIEKLYRCTTTMELGEELQHIVKSYQNKNLWEKLEGRKYAPKMFLSTTPKVPTENDIDNYCGTPERGALRMIVEFTNPGGLPGASLVKLSHLPTEKEYLLDWEQPLQIVGAELKDFRGEQLLHLKVKMLMRE